MIFQEEASTEILKILDLINNTENSQKNMAKEKINQEFRFKQIYKIKNYFTEERKQNKLISKKYKMICKILNYTEHLLILTSTVTWCFSISVFAFLVGISVGTPNTIQVLISKALIRSSISQYEFVLVNNVLK